MVKMLILYYDTCKMIHRWSITTYFLLFCGKGLYLFYWYSFYFVRRCYSPYG